MQALAGSFGGRSQAFKAHSGVDQVAQNDTGRRRFAIEEQRRRLVQQRRGERRFAPHPLTDGLFKVSAQRHDSPHSHGPGLRARYASLICMARLMSLFWLALVPPVNSRSEEHTSELQSLMRSSYAVFCLKK